MLKGGGGGMSGGKKKGGTSHDLKERKGVLDLEESKKSKKGKTRYMF